MQWYECWHSEGVAPQFTKPPLFSSRNNYKANRLTSNCLGVHAQARYTV